jgi:hypothetical protein
MKSLQSLLNLWHFKCFEDSDKEIINLEDDIYNDNLEDYICDDNLDDISDNNVNGINE